MFKSPQYELTPPVYIDAPAEPTEVASALDSAPSGLVTTNHGSFVPTPSESSSPVSFLIQGHISAAFEQLLSSFTDVFC